MLIEANPSERTFALSYEEVREIEDLRNRDLTVFIALLEKPGAPTVVIGQSDIQATSLTVKWTAPADDGGSPITAYRVVIQNGSTEIKNENVTDPGTTSLSVGGLERDTNYTVKVFARNAVFEGPAGEKAVKTKYEGKAM